MVTFDLLTSKSIGLFFVSIASICASFIKTHQGKLKLCGRNQFRTERRTDGKPNSIVPRFCERRWTI